MGNKQINTSKELRQDQKLLRNQFTLTGKYGIPCIENSRTPLPIELIGADKIKSKATIQNCIRTVHFFLEDKKLNRFYNNPLQYIQILAQYQSVLTPDFSLYTDMPIAIQLNNTFKNRWCGALWQRFGLIVIPTISWSTPESFDFCFDGIEKCSIVAISTIGVNKEKNLFLQGYKKMLEVIQPRKVICYGNPFIEMGNETISFPFRNNVWRKK